MSKVIYIKEWKERKRLKTFDFDARIYALAYFSYDLKTAEDFLDAWNKHMDALRNNKKEDNHVDSGDSQE